METRNHKINCHIVVPALPALLFFVNAALPKTFLGCANRGWVALVIALVTAVAALISVSVAVRKRMANETDSQWWIITTLILMISPVALLILG